MATAGGAKKERQVRLSKGPLLSAPSPPPPIQVQSLSKKREAGNVEPSSSFGASKKLKSWRGGASQTLLQHGPKAVVQLNDVFKGFLITDEEVGTNFSVGSMLPHPTRDLQQQEPSVVTEADCAVVALLHQA